MARSRVFLDIALADAAPQRVVFELFNDVVPKTAENFRALATGEKGLSQVSQVPLYYKDSIIHRSIKGFMIQGGDFTKRNGGGGESIYGMPFPDEDLSQPLDSEGLLVMANKGPNTNGSQFFVTLRACPHLDGKHVVFGRVLKGYEVIEAIADVPTDEKDRPLQPVVIVNCGELVRKAAPAQAEARKRSVSRSRSRSRSRSASDDDKEERKKKHHSKRKSRDEDEDRTHKKKKHKSDKKKHSSSKHKDHKADDKDKDKDDEPHKETEEEYDARLEREEKERLEASRRYHLAELKRRAEREVKPSSNGIIYKGRGEMRFRDY